MRQNAPGASACISSSGLRQLALVCSKIIVNVDFSPSKAQSSACTIGRMLTMRVLVLLFFSAMTSSAALKPSTAAVRSIPGTSTEYSASAICAISAGAESSTSAARRHLSPSGSTALSFSKNSSGEISPASSTSSISHWLCRPTDSAVANARFTCGLKPCE